jgi:hypothetical protein
MARASTALAAAAAAFAGLGSPAAAARSCPDFNYHGSRIVKISASGISCSGAKSLIPAAYRATGAHEKNPGQYVAVENGWRCTTLRPYFDRANRYQGADCKAPGRHLSWKSQATLKP